MGIVITIFFITFLIRALDTPLAVNIDYLIGAPRLNDSSCWDYYFSCNTKGATLIWEIDGNQVGIFSSRNIRKTLSSTERSGYNFSAILLSSQQIRNNYYSFYSILIVSVPMKSTLNISCANVQEISYVVTETRLNALKRTGNNSVGLEYLWTTGLANIEGYSFTSVFVCGVNNEVLRWRTQTNIFIFHVSDRYGQVQNNFQQYDNTVRQLSILIAHEPYQIVTVLFIMVNTTDVTVQCGYKNISFQIFTNIPSTTPELTTLSTTEDRTTDESINLVNGEAISGTGIVFLVSHLVVVFVMLILIVILASIFIIKHRRHPRSHQFKELQSTFSSYEHISNPKSLTRSYKRTADTHTEEEQILSIPVPLDNELWANLFGMQSASWDLIDRKHILYCGHATEETWKKHKFVMEFQKDSLPLDVLSANIDIYVYLSGNFKLPDNSLPVSAFYSVLCSHKLVKEVCLKIEHCATNTSNLKFAISSDNCPPYKFELVDDGMFFEKHGEIRRKKFSRIVIVFLSTLASWVCPVSYYSALCSSPQYNSTWTIYLFVTLCTSSHIYYLKEDAKKHNVAIQDKSELQIEKGAEYLEMDITVSNENRRKGLDLLAKYNPRICIYVKRINNIWYNETASASFKLKLMTRKRAIFHQPYYIKGATLSNDSLHLSLCTDASVPYRHVVVSASGDSSLRVANLAEVFGQCYDARNKWFYIGLRLIPEHVSFLDDIEASSTSKDDRFRIMLKKWLEVGKERTWNVICQALRHHTVARPDVAETITAFINENT